MEDLIPTEHQLTRPLYDACPQPPLVDRVEVSLASVRDVCPAVAHLSTDRGEALSSLA